MGRWTCTAGVHDPGQIEGFTALNASPADPLVVLASLSLSLVTGLGHFEEYPKAGSFFGDVGFCPPERPHWTTDEEPGLSLGILMACRAVSWQTVVIPAL
jgi:hypothetical protein